MQDSPSLSQSDSSQNLLNLNPWPKQNFTLFSPAQEILYGGAAGPGKSWLARLVAITCCMAVPGFQMFIFRRTRPDLYLSHYVGKNNFHEMLADMILAKQVTISNLEIKFANGSKIHGCHCEHEKDVYNYKSVEMHGRIMEETTEFTPFQLQYIGTRARFPEDLVKDIPAWLLPKLPMALYPTNFDDQGGSKEYLCQLFKVYDNWNSPNRYNPTEIWTAGETEQSTGKTRQYIPALLDDNPSINKRAYTASLMELRHPEMVRSLLEGDPTVQMGSLWPEMSRERNVLKEHIDPLKHYAQLYAHDWGSSAPAATIWACIIGDEGLGPMPRGSIYVYKYQLIARDKDRSKGLGWSNKQIAESMYRLEPQHDQPYLSDSLPFQARGGIPMFEEYSDAGIHLHKADVSSKEVSTQAVRSLVVGRNGVTDLYISPECDEVFRTCALMRPHVNKPEKPADHKEDHIPDCLQHIGRAWKTIQDAAIPSAERNKAQAMKEWNKKESLRDLDIDLSMIFDE